MLRASALLRANNSTVRERLYAAVMAATGLLLGVAPSGAYAAALPTDRRAALKDELRRGLDVADGPSS